MPRAGPLIHRVNEDGQKYRQVTRTTTTQAARGKMSPSQPMLTQVRISTAALLEAHSGRCAVAGFDAAAALEGAHLRPYLGPGSNAVTNGLLLRADIHTLFDLGLLAPDPMTRTIAVSKLLAGTQYEASVQLPAR